MSELRWWHDESELASEISEVRVRGTREKKRE